MANSPFDVTLTFDTESDPVFPMPPDAGEDTDFTDHNLPHVYRVEGYLLDDSMNGRRKPQRTHSTRDVEINAVHQIAPDGSESEVPWRHWQAGEEGIQAAVVADFEHQYDGWDGGA